MCPQPRKLSTAVRDMSGSRTANPYGIFRIFRIFREAGDHRRRGLASRIGRALLPSMRSVDPIGDRVLIRVVPTRAEGGEWNPVPDGRCDTAAREPPWPWPYPPGTLGVTGGNGGAPRRSQPDQVPAQRTGTCPGTGPPSHVTPDETCDRVRTRRSREIIIIPCNIATDIDRPNPGGLVYLSQ